MLRVDKKDLTSWADRKRAIEEIQGSAGYQLILARITQERDDADAKLLNTWRWNWFRILRLLMQRDTAQSLLNYVEGVKSVGTQAEIELLKLDPNYIKERRASFIHS